LDNVATRQIRARLWRKDELLKEEIHTKKLEDYNKDELVLMLEHAGFSDIQSLEISVTNQPSAARAAAAPKPPTRCRCSSPVTAS